MYLTKVAVLNFIKELKKLDINSESYQQSSQKISRYLLNYYINFGNVLMENEFYKSAENIYHKA